MHATRMLLAGALPLFLLASCGTSPTRTKTIEVPVEVTIPLRQELTAPEPKPARPVARCTDAGKPTLCTADLAAWLNAYDASLGAINARMAEIRGLQPKADAPTR